MKLTNSLRDNFDRNNIRKNLNMNNFISIKEIKLLIKIHP